MKFSILNKSRAVGNLAKQLSAYILMAGVFLLTPMMAHAESASESKISPLEAVGVDSIGVVVEDVNRAARHYNDLLNINHWRFTDMDVENSDGSSAGAAIRIARGQFKNKTIELIQPLYGDSAFSRYLTTHGAGLFHLGVDSKILESMPRLKEFAVFAQAKADVSHAPGFNKPSQAKWINSWDKLGVNFKLEASSLERDEDSPEQDKSSWGELTLSKNDKLTPLLKDSRITQLGVVVADTMVTAKNWRHYIGLAPWLFVDFKPPATSNGFYHGVHGDAYSHVNIGYGQWKDLQIELLQSVAGPTPHRDYLRSKGQGAHHLSLGRLPQHDDLSQFYQQDAKLELQMQSDNGGPGRTASYMSSEAELGFVLEFTAAFKGLGTLTVSGQLGPEK